MLVTLSHQTALAVYFDNPRLAQLPRTCVLDSERIRMQDLVAIPQCVSARTQIDVLVEKASLRGWSGGFLAYHVLPAACPADSFVRCGEYALTCPELLFLQFAAHLDLLDLVLLGYRMCGDYRPSSERFRTGNLPLTTPEKLVAYIEKCTGCKGAKQAHRALKYVLAGANSTMEARLTVALIFPRRWGGYELSFPELNVDIFGTTRTGDLCWLDKNLVVEYDSAAHHAEPYAQERDSVRRAEMGLRGVRVITVSRMQVSDSALFDQAARYIAKSLGEGTRNRSKKCEKNREELLFRLFHCFDEDELFLGG